MLFDKKNFTPQIAIELDDNSHELQEREDRDNFVNQVMKKTGIKIIHIKTSSNYNLEEIKNLIY